MREEEKDCCQDLIITYFFDDEEDSVLGSSCQFSPCEVVASLATFITNVKWGPNQYCQLSKIRSEKLVTTYVNYIFLATNFIL